MYLWGKHDCRVLLDSTLNFDHQLKLDDGYQISSYLTNFKHADIYSSSPWKPPPRFHENLCQISFKTIPFIAQRVAYIAASTDSTTINSTATRQAKIASKMGCTLWRVGHDFLKFHVVQKQGAKCCYQMENKHYKLVGGFNPFEKY